MRYIRFLKSPRFEGDTIKALATITSDLGESQMVTPCDLIPLISAFQNEECKSVVLPTRKWSPGMRVVPITWTPSKEVLAIPSMSFSLTVFAVDVRTGSKSIQNRLPGGGGGRRTDAGFPLVLSVSSGLFQVGTPASGESKRTFEVADGSELTITELPGDSIEGHIWDAGYATVGFLNHLLAARLRFQTGREYVQTDQPRRMEPTSVLELGCGTGLVGLFLATIVPHCAVTLTDLPAACELVEQNIEQLSRPATGSSAQFRVLEWGKPLPDEIESEQWDVIILTDCTYNPSYATALVNTMQQIQSRSPDVLIIFASKKRHDTEDLFGELMVQTGYASHNRFAIALPTDNNISASMWAENDAADDVDLVLFTLYTKGHNHGTDTSVRHPRWAKDHILEDLYVRDKKWSGMSVKRKNGGMAKAMAKAKRKKNGAPYEYGT